MSRINSVQLRKMIQNEEFDYTLLSSVLSEYTGFRQKIHALLESGVITRVKKGLYVFGDSYNQAPICKETLANLIYGPSCLSLEYALSFHGFIPERVEVLTSITPKKDKTFSTPLGHFTYRYLSLEKYAIGIEQRWIDQTHPILIASPEKALCDYIALKRVRLSNANPDPRNFLENDLRIDQDHWKQFNLNELRKLSKVYRNQSIEKILEMLEQEERR